MDRKEVLLDMLDVGQEIASRSQPYLDEYYNKTSDAIESWMDYRDGDIPFAVTSDGEIIDSEDGLRDFLDEYYQEAVESISKVISKYKGRVLKALEVFGKGTDEYSYINEFILMADPAYIEESHEMMTDEENLKTWFERHIDFIVDTFSEWI